jgi:hypothetical protein
MQCCHIIKTSVCRSAVRRVNLARPGRRDAGISPGRDTKKEKNEDHDREEGETVRGLRGISFSFPFRRAGRGGRQTPKLRAGRRCLGGRLSNGHDRHTSAQGATSIFRKWAGNICELRSSSVLKSFLSR